MNGSRGKFYIRDGDQLYTLTGNTSGLAKYVNQEVAVQGKESASTQPLWRRPIPGATDLSFEVVRVKQVFTPKQRLSPSFSNSSTWHTETNRTYGINFAHPGGVSALPTSKSIPLAANFVTDQELITVARFEIPREAYPNTNFVGGFFAIFLDPQITNGPSCSQFGTVNPHFPSSYPLGKIHYASTSGGSGAAGSWSGDYYFHAFQNGVCYELAFELVEDSSLNEDLGCRIPRLGQRDDLNLIETFIAQVSFFSPTFAARRESNPHAVPRVTDFVASAQRADVVTNRGPITFSWSTQNTDYVEFSYRCLPAPNEPGVVILEPDGSRECENANPRLYPRTAPIARPMPRKM